MVEMLAEAGVDKVDAIVLDIGVSSMQLDEAERGFSFMKDAPLDMRMSQSGTTAADIVNHADEAELTRILRDYGEERDAKRIARAIIHSRGIAPITTTKRLAEIVSETLRAHGGMKIHPATRTFQALRIEVNQEMEVLEKFLLQTQDVLKPEGRLVVMSYHSLEDRMVKNLMKRGNIDGSIEKDFYGNVLKPFEEITRKPVSPSEEEIQRNTRARSARLRIAKRLTDGGK